MPRLITARWTPLIAAFACMLGVSVCAQNTVVAPKMARIGMLSDSESFGNPISPQDWLAAFRAGLQDAGYHNGKNISFEFRNADRDPQKLAQQASELVTLRVDLIVASSTTAAKAAKAATRTIPIVLWGAEPDSICLDCNHDNQCASFTLVTENKE